MRFLFPLLLGCLATLSTSVVSAESPGRVVDGLQVLYDFRNAASDSLKPSSSTGVQFTDSGLKLSQETSLQAPDEQAKRLIDSIQSTGAITLEAWFRAANNKQAGPARIVTLSSDTSNRNFTLGQERDEIHVRLRRRGSDNNGLPGVHARVDGIDQDWHHVAFTYQNGQPQRLYLDGVKAATANHRGRLDNWIDTMPLLIGNESKGGRAWKGDLALVAIYNRVLPSEQVHQNYQAGRHPQRVDSPPTMTPTTKTPANPFVAAADHFETHIAPLLSRHCLNCHDASDSKGGLDLSRKGPAFTGGESGVAIVSGYPEESLLWTHVESDEMPLDNPPLSDQEKRLLQAWISGGALWSLDTIDPAVYRHGTQSTDPADHWVSRLTQEEYIETVRAVFGVDIRDEALRHLPPDLRADGFRNTAYNLTVDFGHVSAYAQLADFIVGKLDLETFARTFTGKRDFTDKTMRPLVEAIGNRVLRGNLSQDEIALYRGITTTVALSGGTFDDAVGYVLRAMLQSPRFLYRLERPDPDREHLWQADPYEVASRLSYTVWGGPPDTALFKAAREHQLGSETEIRNQLSRMWDDPRAVDRSIQFLSQWLDLDRLENLSPNRKLFPGWTPELAQDMRRETIDTFRYWVWELNQPLVGLVDTPVTFASPRLAQHYGFPAKQDAWARYDLTDVGSRSGILTQGSLLTIGGDNASMVTRGLFVLHDLLFSEVGDPPPGLDLTPVPTAPGRTHRMVAEERIHSEACGGCHKRFEPLAFGLERYDGLGSYHEQDQYGNPLRQDGKILFPGKSQPVDYQTTAEMTHLLASSDRVAECLTRKVIQFSIGRPLKAGDVRALQKIYEQAGRQQATYRQIVTELLTVLP